MYWLGKSGIGNSAVAQGKRELLLSFAVAVVGADDSLDQLMAYDVDVIEVAEADAFDPVEDVKGFEEAGLFRVGQISLGKVAGDDRLGVVAETGNEHLHLLGRGVLRFVHDDESVVESATSHEGERGDFDDIGLEHLVDLDGIDEVIESVIKGPEIRIDFFLERAWEEAKAFAGFDRGADKDNAVDFFRHEGADGHGYGKVSFPGPGRAEAEGHVRLFDRLDVFSLVGRARLHHALDPGGALAACVDERFKGDRRVGDDQFEHAVEFAVVEIDAGLAKSVEVGEDLFDAGDAVGFAGDVDGIGAEIDRDVEFVFEEAEIFVVGSVERLNARRDFQGFFDQVVC